MSTFSPVGSQSSNAMRERECVCGWVGVGLCGCVCVCVCARARACVRNGLEVVHLRWHIHMYQFIPYYASAIHAHTHASSHHLRTANRRS